jgi:hypothetical protein
MIMNLRFSKKTAKHRFAACLPGSDSVRNQDEKHRRPARHHDTQQSEDDGRDRHSFQEIRFHACLLEKSDKKWTAG